MPHSKEGALSTAVPDFFDKPAPITNIVDTKEYDLIVIGAGSPGVPCALRAAELGAKVAILQKEPEAAACGNFGAGVDLANSNAADVEALVSLLVASSAHRAKRARIEAWAKNSGDAVSWIIKKAQEAGAQVTDMGTAVHGGLLNKHGWDIAFHTCVFGPKPYDTGEAMKALCAYAASHDLVDIFYSTPAKQLVQNEAGAVTGVIAQTSAGFTQFNARAGVVVATGDYANDKRMMDYYLPDVTHLDLKRTGRTGDGHKMIVWAGGYIENVGHTKMCHDMDSGSPAIMDAPYLRVKLNGERFCNETVGMELMNCYLNSARDRGHYCQIFDSAYIEKSEHWDMSLPDKETMKNWMPEEDIEHKGVVENLINTFKADSLEELAEKLEIQDTSQFIETVNSYNACAKKREDDAFGVPAKFLSTIDTPPYYGIHRHVRFTVGCSGVVVNEKLQCLNTDDQPIKGLYAIGNLAGNFYGGVDYPLDVFGLNLGHNYTEGYIVAQELFA